MEQHDSNGQRTVVQLMDEYVALVKSGKSKRDAREYMLVNGTDEKLLKEAIRSVENLSLLHGRREEIAHQRSSSFYIGLVLVVIGISLSIWGYIASDGYRLGGGLLVYGPVISGLSMLAYGRVKAQRMRR
jgi:hypothetical protein